MTQVYQKILDKGMQAAVSSATGSTGRRKSEVKKKD
jgi:hypothetical protein